MMNDNVNIFKKIILFQILFTIFYFYYYFFSFDSDYYWRNIMDLNVFDVLGYSLNPWNWFVLTLIPIYYYILFLLYKLKPQGKKLFLTFVILWEVLLIAHTDLNDYIYDNRFQYYLEYLDYFLTGVIITFLYFTDVKKEFEK